MYDVSIEDLRNAFRYNGSLKSYRGCYATELSEMKHGPFRYKVLAQSGFYCPRVTFYYLTWTGFLADWKRTSVGGTS